MAEKMTELTIYSRIRRHRIFIARTLFSLLFPLKWLRKITKDEKAVNIIIFEWYMLGDLVMIAPVIEGLKTAYPEHHVILVCDQSWLPVAQYLNGIDELVGVRCPWSPRHKNGFFKHIFPFLREIRRIFKRPAHMIVSLRGDPRDHILQGLLPSEMKLGLKFMGAEYMLTHVAGPGRKIHQVETACDVIGTVAPYPTQTPHINRNKVLADNSLNLGKNYIAINLGASNPIRQVKSNVCEELDHALNETGQSHWFFHIGELDGTSIINKKKLDLSAYIGAIAKASLVICTDSATAHIAVALDRPTLVLFGPGAPEIVRPIGHSPIKIAIGPCPEAPCFGHCIYSKPYCMEYFTASEIIRLLNEFQAEL